MPIGKIEPYNLSSNKWPAYIRRVNQYILLNEVEDNLKVSMLITLVGEETYDLMCDLCSPELPEDKKYDELVELVKNHLEPKRSEIAERHMFRLRRQKEGESLSEYLQALKHLASTCNFEKCARGCNSLEINLRDQFVSGLASEAMRSRIFAEKNIQYKEAVELALALEAAEKHAVVSAATSTSSLGALPSSVSTSNEAGESLHYARSGRRPRSKRAAAGAPGEGGGSGNGSSGGAGASSSAGSQAAGSAPRPSCWRCGKAHRAERCRFINYNCDVCNQRGHLKVMCKQVRNNGQDSNRQNYVSDDESDDMFNIDVVMQGNRPYFIKLFIDEKEIECEIDTGSRISAISEQLYEQLFSNKKLFKDNLMLRSYSGSRIESLGYILVDVQLGSICGKSLHLYIIRGGARPLLGRDWMHTLKVTQININEIIDDGFVNQLCCEFPEVFSNKLGTCKQTIRLQLTDKEPVYVRARPVPLALRERVERELNRLQADGTIYRVDNSDYGTPIVPVVKENGEIRICGDYKITINPKLKRDYYPLPRIEELFSNLSGGEEYTKIDLRHAYEQCLISVESQPFTAITTHIGTFVYKRTPYGLSCIPEKFQKIMEETLRGIPKCVVFLDDVCVTGATRQEHMSNVRAVLVRLRDMGLTVKLSKCKFLQKSVKYLGFIINKEGLRPDPTKIEAISNAPEPENVTQLKGFLGMLNYYSKFVKNLSTLLHPLHRLLKKEISWNWDSKCKQAFLEAKKVLLSDRVLVHYEAGRPLVLSVDSSAYGLGAVLAHRFPDGSERPVSCVSRTLSASERNYSQLDKEALAILFGVTKHHQYLFGRHFILRSDHQPLTYIFGPKGGIPQTAASRLQRWAARLAAYDFTIEFVRSAENGPADALSRLPLSKESLLTSKETVNYINFVEEMLPINFKDVARETERDRILSKVKGYIMFGWPSVPSCDEEKPYFDRKTDLIIEMGCLIYKYRIVIPICLRKQVLNEIHEGHVGINKMKTLARNYVYWPNIDAEIESVCRACGPCRAVRDAAPHAPLHPWEYPMHPWQRVHADFADCAGKRYLIMVDANSKWIEAIPMRYTDSSATIKAMRNIFSRFGLPSQLVTDNGPPFFAQEFKDFCMKNCIKHVTSAPYRPQGNGAAENAVKTVKKAIKRAVYSGEDVTTALSKFLLKYRNCEHATTGVSPAEALQGRRLRTRLDALRPDRNIIVDRAQQRQIMAKGGVERQFSPGEKVLVREYTGKERKWSEGTVLERSGPTSYTVNRDVGTKCRRHVDQMLSTKNNRFSLSRASTVSNSESMKDSGAEDISEEAPVAAERASTSPPGWPRNNLPSECGPPQPGMPAAPDRAAAVLAPPPPDVSARALRAYQRAQRALAKID